MENQNDLPMPWTDVIKLPEFQQFTPEQQSRARDLYFTRFVAPRLASSDLERGRQRFMELAVLPDQLEDRTWGEAVSDLGASFGRGAGGLVSLAGTGYGLITGDMENPVREYGDYVSEWYQERKSPGLKAREARKDRAIQSVDGELGKFGVALKEIATDPALLPSFLMEQVPNLAVTGVFGRAAQGGAALIGMGQRSAAAVGVAGAVGSGAAMQGADAGGEAFDALMDMEGKDLEWAMNEAYRKLRADGVDDYAAREQVSLELSRVAAMQSAVASLGIQAASPWARSIERSLVGKADNASGSMLAGAAKGLVGEAVSNAAEEATVPLARNMALAQIDPEQPLTEDIGEAAAMGSLFGVFGAASGASNAAASAADAGASHPVDAGQSGEGESAADADGEAQQIVNLDDIQAVTGGAQAEGVAGGEQASLNERGTGTYRVAVDDIQVDPQSYQFRSEVGREGVDSRLDSIEKWDDMRAGTVVLHERADGSLFVADGHHRVSLAKRLEQPEINARILRESDGYTVADARREAALINIANDNATAVDVAKVFRDSDMAPEQVRKEANLPNSQLARDGEALAKLGDDVFGLVASGQMDPKDGAAIGRMFADTGQQAEAARIFQNARPETEYQRQMLANEIRNAGFFQRQGEQGGLFGDDAETVGLLQNRLKVMDRLRQALSSDKRLFGTLNDNADRASEAGNQINMDENARISESAQRNIDLLSRVGTTPTLNAMVNDAAERVANGDPIAQVVRDLKSEMIEYGRAQATQERGAGSAGSEQTDRAGAESGPGQSVSEGNTRGSDGQRESDTSTEGQAQPFDLSPQTEESLAASERQRADERQAEADQARAQEQRELADAQLEGFSLTGSDRDADVAAAAGQDSLFSFAGDRAKTADLFNRDLAQKLLAEGKTPEIVRRRTGWFRGADGAWRFEIADNDARLIDVDSLVPRSRGRYLSDILDHPRLFAAYPSLATVQVRVVSDADYRGAYLPRADSIELSADLSPDQMLSTLLHEIQHAIQHREGFAIGSSPEPQVTTFVKQALRDLDESAAQELSLWTWRNRSLIEDADQAAEVARFALLYSSAERLTEYSMRDQPSGVFRLIRNEMQWIYDPMLTSNAEARELQRAYFDMPKRHRARERNEHIRDMAFRAGQLFREQVPADLVQRFRSDKRTMRSMLNALQREASRKREALAPLHELEKRVKAAKALSESVRLASNYDVYRAMAGEVEARNTQARQSMTDEERQQMSPLMTEDVAPENIIVMYGGLDVRAPQIMRSQAPHNADSIRAAMDRSMPGVRAALERSGLLRVMQAADLPAGTAASQSQAFVSDGVVTVLADNVVRGTDIKGMLLHEVGVHLMQLGRDSAEFQQLQRQFQRLTLTSDKAKAAMARVPEGTPANLRLEEGMGYFVEMNPSLSFPQRLLAWVRAKLKEWLGAVKGADRLRLMRWANELTEVDLIYMAQAAARSVGQAVESRADDTVLASEPEQGVAEQFVAAPDGSLNFGEITPEMAKTAGRQAGKIRLQQGEQRANGTGYGLAHIEANHGKQIRRAGFGSVEEFVAQVARNFNQIRKAGAGQLLVAAKGERENVLFVQLQPASDGDYYRINTAFPASRDYLAKQEKKGGVLLWGGSEPTPTAAGKQPLYAGNPEVDPGQDAPIAQGQSTDSIAQQPVDNETRYGFAGQTETPSFRRWFGDSKVVDAEGQPLIVYHGTTADFSVFDRGAESIFNYGDTQDSGGIFFGTDAEAINYYMEGARGVERGANIIPAYLSIRNPASLPAAMPLEDQAKALREAEAAGHDGARIGEDQWVVFRPEQIKSAIGNRGTFDPGNADIRYSIAERESTELPLTDLLPAAELQSRPDQGGLSVNQEQGRPGVELPPETRARRAQRILQDKLNRFTVVQNWLADRGTTLSEGADVYRAEERMHSRFANKAKDFREKTVQPLIKKIQAAGFTMDQVAQVLHAQHAPERNAQIRTINPRVRDGAGMDDATAMSIMAGADPKLVRLANEFRDITDRTRETLVRSGLLDRETADAWQRAYQHYAPLKGGPGAKSHQQGTGKGLSVKHKPKRALGHQVREEGEFIIENILADHERALMLAEKNLVGQHLLRMALEIKMPELMTVNQPEKRAVLQQRKGYEVLYRGTPIGVFSSQEAANIHKANAIQSMRKSSPSDFTIRVSTDPSVAYMASPVPGPNEALVYVDGHLVRIQINDDLLARAYNNLGAENMNAVLQAGRALNNWFSRVYTGYSPEFIVTNMVRDFTNGVINIAGEEGGKFAAKAVANYGRAFSELLRYGATGNESRWIKMYREDGGNTGAAYLSDLERLGKDVLAEYDAYKGLLANLKDKNLRGAARSAGRQAFNKTIRIIEIMNEAGENSMRLAVYRAAVESGMSRNKAASLSKNVTVNFNRKGEMGAQLNALYLFFNAAVQGSAAIGHSLFMGKHKYQAWGLSAALAGLGWSMAMLAGGGDEDEYEKLPDYTRERNFVIRAGDGWATVPVPYGHGFFWNLGRIIGDGNRTGEWGTAPWHLAASFVEETTPFGGMVAGDEPSLAQAALFGAPTAFQIPGVVAFNRTSFGGELYPESPFDKSQPDRLKMYRGTTGTWADNLAGALEMAGIDVSPETLKYLNRTFTGGAGNFVGSAVDASVLAAGGAAPEVREIPFARRFYRESDVRDARSRFWDSASAARAATEEIRRAERGGDHHEVARLRRESAQLVAMDKLARSFQQSASALRDQAERIRLDESLSTVEKRDRIRKIEEREIKLYDRYVSIYKERTRD